MRLGAGVVVIVVCAAVLLGYACAQADDAALSYSSGMVSVLDEHATVRMATCQIAADIYERQSKVRCQFEFLNEGPPTMVTMGFPAFAGSEGGEKLSPDLRDFRSWVGGKRVPTEIVEETDNSKHGPDRWYVKHVYFERGMRRSVRNTYIQPHGDSTSGVHWFPYKLTTGSSWHGPIGRLSVTLRWQEPWEWVPHVQESNWRWRRSDDGHALSWNGENVEPATNVHLDFELGWRDLFCDGFRIEPFPVGHFRVSGDRLEMPVEPLARILRAGVKFDNQAKAVRLIRGDQRIVLTLGRSFADIDGEKLPLPGPVQLGRYHTWANADVLWRHFGHRIEMDRDKRAVRVFTGQPVVWEAKVQGHSESAAAAHRQPTVHLASVDGVLIGETGPIVREVESVRRVSLNPEGYPLPECHTLEMLSADRTTSERRLTFRFGSRQAVLDKGASRPRRPGRVLDATAIELPVAPYVSVKGTGMFPVRALCEAFEMTWDYDDTEKLLTFSG